MNLHRPSITNLDQASISQIEQRLLHVVYEKSIGLIAIRGWSIAPNVGEKYRDVLSLINSHLSEHRSLRIHFKFDLFNTSSATYLFKIISKLNIAFKNGKDIQVHWSCGSEHKEGLLDAGIDLFGMSDFDFIIS